MFYLFFPARTGVIYFNIYLFYWSLMIVSSVLTSAILAIALVNTVASFSDSTWRTCGGSLPEPWIIMECVVRPPGVTVSVSMFSPLLGSTFGTCTTGVTQTVPSLFVWRCWIFATIVWYIDADTGTVITPLTANLNKKKQI